MSKKWSADEESALRQALKNGESVPAMVKMLGRSVNSVRNKIQDIRDNGELIEREESTVGHREIKSASREALERPSISYEEHHDTLRKLRETELELSRLREQKKWETRSSSDSFTGGVMTIRASDLHHADENHLLSCAASLQDKLCILIDQYKPDRIQYIGFDDWIAGRGIFKEQDLSMAVSDPDHQVVVGAMKARKLFSAIRSVSSAPIHVHWLRGNHEYVNRVSIAGYLFDKTSLLCSDIADLKFTMHYDRALINLATEGSYIILAMHGFGHSNASPNSPRFIDTAKDIVIKEQRAGVQIRRVTSGHTHWFSLGLERIVDLPFDTTGGMQRNTRVQLGMNQRPVGWITYISHAGMRDDIISPIGLHPDHDIYDRENRDPHLKSSNRSDCAECLREYGEIMKGRGLLDTDDEFGVKEGRW